MVLSEIDKPKEDASLRGLSIDSYFSSDSFGPKLEWGKRDIKVLDGKGRTVFEMQDIEAPTSYSDLAVKTIASKYFCRNKKASERSTRALDDRVVTTIGYEVARQRLINPKDEKTYTEELRALVEHQISAWNSPVWFNQGLNHVYGIRRGSGDEDSQERWAVDLETGQIGNGFDAYERPQNSACFIQSVPDDLTAILRHGVKEGKLFQYGSGTGSNFSSIRGINEPLSGGGSSSGVTSFLSIFNRIAGSIMSGGTTRRAAKMLVLDGNHPDIFRYIQLKVEEEQKALQLMKDKRWDRENPWDIDSAAHRTVDAQNGNNSVRLTDEFMEALRRDGDWDLVYRTADRAGEEKDIPLERYKDDRYLPDRKFIKRLTNKRKVVKAKDLWDQIVRAATLTADPGVQFDDTINKWHTCKNSGRINASNPCSEYMFLDDSACNLASLNLLSFRTSDGGFNVEAFRRAVRLNIISQEALVDQSSYPSKSIAQNSHDFRPLGLGYGNLGALLMAEGLPYNSPEGRAFAGAITSLMTAQSYKTSAEMAREVGPFAGFEKNRESMLEVIRMHKEADTKIDRTRLPKRLEEIVEASRQAWAEALELGEKYGYRNSQVTVIAPTGTIGFKMDFDTTGVEPLPVFGASKGLAGGGKYVFPLPVSLEEGLKSLGYKEEEREAILDYINKQNEMNSKVSTGEQRVATMKGAPGLREEHLPVFETAMDPRNMIPVDGHLEMMAAVTPFLSGSASKTVNLPRGSTLADIDRTYRRGYELGLKSIALYVDGCKGVQPIFTGGDSSSETGVLGRGDKDKPGSGRPIDSFRIPIAIGDTKVLIEFGEHPNRKPSEAVGDYIVMFGKSGSPHAAETTEWAKAASRERQLGESLETFIQNNKGSTGTIRGLTNHPYIRSVSSVYDAVAKLAELHYLGITDSCDVKPKESEMDELRINVLKQRNRDAHFSSRIKRMRVMMEKGEDTPIIGLEEDGKSNGSSMGKGGMPPCMRCGHPTQFSGANCHKCTNCGYSPGCG